MIFITWIPKMLHTCHCFLTLNLMSSLPSNSCSNLRQGDHWTRKLIVLRSKAEMWPTEEICSHQVKDSACKDGSDEGSPGCRHNHWGKHLASWSRHADESKWALLQTSGSSHIKGRENIWSLLTSFLGPKLFDYLSIKLTNSILTVVLK